jgi:hypothetical protein
VLSAGSAPKDSIFPIAVEALAEGGIDIASYLLYSAWMEWNN